MFCGAMVTQGLGVSDGVIAPSGSFVAAGVFSADEQEANSNGIKTNDKKCHFLFIILFLVFFHAVN